MEGGGLVKEIDGSSFNRRENWGFARPLEEP
jgi:hypothetical protein